MYVLDGVQIPRGKGQFWGKRAPIVKYIRHSAVTCAKTAEPIVMPFGLSARYGSRNHELDVGPDPSPEKQQFLEKRSPTVKYKDFLP